MLGRIFPRSIVRIVVPRISQPLLPITSRFMTPEARALTLAPRTSPFRFFHGSRARLSSPPPSPSSPSSTPPPNPTLTQRLKILIKSYGWYALGVYIFFSALDFGVAFIGINLLGAEHVSALAASAKAWVLSFVTHPPEPGREALEDPTPPNGSEGLYAMLVLAYTVHKTLFLPVRIGLTAALTPRLVGWLRARGWAGKAGTVRAAREMRERLRERD